VMESGLSGTVLYFLESGVSDGYNRGIIMIYSLNLNQLADSDSINPLIMILNMIQ
jgi:hypothetical protein